MQFGCETARQLWHHMLSKYLLPYWRLLAGQLVLAAKIGRTGKNYEKLRRPKVSLSHSMPWCHVLHNEVGGFLIATPAYLDDGHVIPCDLEAVWVEGPRSVPQLDLAGLLPFWDLKGTGHLSVSFFSGPKCGLLENRIPPKFTKNILRINTFIIMFLIDWARTIIGDHWSIFSSVLNLESVFPDAPLEASLTLQSCRTWRKIAGQRAS